MRVAGRYSHKSGEEFIQENHPNILAEIETVISSIDAEACRLKEPQDKEKIRAERA